MLTAKGKKVMELVNSYGLGDYFNPFMGNILIRSLADVKEKVSKFLKENPDWVLGYEAESGYYYITEIDNLI